MSILSKAAPILIFNFPFDSDSQNPIFNALSGLPLLGDSVAGVVTSIGVPIPIYLDEQLTGLYVENENKNIDISTEQNDAANSTKPFLTQKSISNTVSINLVGKKDSIFVTALLALVDIAYPQLVKAKYRVSYLNGPTVVLGGLIQGVTAQAQNDSELVNISIVIHKADSLGPTAPAFTSVSSIAGPSLTSGVHPVVR